MLLKKLMFTIEIVEKFFFILKKWYFCLHLLLFCLCIRRALFIIEYTCKSVVEQKRLTYFEGKENVTVQVDECGRVKYLTQLIPFTSLVSELGAKKLSVVEKNQFRFLYLLTPDGKIVGKYYMYASIRRKTPQELVKMKHLLVCFEVYIEKNKDRLPCITLNSMVQQENTKGTVKCNLLNNFVGKENIRVVASKDGVKKYITPTIPLLSIISEFGEVKFRTVEKGNTHVLFFLNSDDTVVGKYYMCKSIQGKTPQELDEIKHLLVCFGYYFENGEDYIPCVSLKSLTRNTSSTEMAQSPSLDSYERERRRDAVGDLAENKRREVIETDIRKEEKDQRSERNFWIFVFILFFVIIPMVMGCIERCMGVKRGILYDDCSIEYQYHRE